MTAEEPMRWVSCWSVRSGGANGPSGWGACSPTPSTGSGSRVWGSSRGAILGVLGACDRSVVDWVVGDDVAAHPSGWYRRRSYRAFTGGPSATLLMSQLPAAFEHLRGYWIFTKSWNNGPGPLKSPSPRAQSCKCKWVRTHTTPLECYKSDNDQASDYAGYYSIFSSQYSIGRSCSYVVGTDNSTPRTVDRCLSAWNLWKTIWAIRLLNDSHSHVKNNVWHYYCPAHSRMCVCL